jgi:hypothetical protein
MSSIPIHCTIYILNIRIYENEKFIISYHKFVTLLIREGNYAYLGLIHIKG